MARWVSFVVLAAIVLLVAGMFAWVMSQFVLPIFLALVLVVIFRPLHLWYARQFGGRIRVAAALTTLTTLLIVLVPAILLGTRAASEGLRAAADMDRHGIQQRLNEMRDVLGLSLPSKPVRDLSENLASLVQDLHRGAADRRDGREAAAPTNVDAARPFPDQVVATPAPLVAEAPETIAAPTEAPVDMAQAIRQSEQVLEQIHSQLLVDAKQARPARNKEERLEREKRAQYIEESRRALVARLDLFAPLAASAPPDELEPPDDEAQANYDRGLAEVERAHDQFRESLFGDPLLHWLKVQANPEDDAERLENLRRFVQESAGPLALSTTQRVAGIVTQTIVGLAIMLISLFYFLADGPAMAEAVMRLSPLEQKFEEQMLREFDKVSRAVVLATLLSATVQGLLAAIGFAVAGVEAVVLLSVLSGILAMVPFVGAASVWGAVSVWLLVFESRPWAAALLALYGVSVISMADNFIKPLVLHGQSNIHPLLALLSVLGGVGALGPIGIFVGPMVVAFLHALLVMLQAELSELSGPEDAHGDVLIAKPPPTRRLPSFRKGKGK